MLCLKIFSQIHSKGLFIWRRAGLVDRAGPLSRDDFYLTFTWSFLSRLTGLEKLFTSRDQNLNAVLNASN